jgi:hypothetical protein
LEDYITFLYGSPKIGKTTFCSQFDQPLFLLTEAGTNALSVYEVPIQSWEDFIGACKLVAKGLDDERKGGENFPFKTLVIDTVDNLLKFCSEHVLKQNGLTHESDAGYGKGYTLVADEFRRIITRLSLMPVGLVMISHEKIEEVKTRTSVINKAIPTIASSHRKLILGMADLILYAHSVTKQTDSGIEEVRVLRTKGSENWEAGDRTGRLPDTLLFTYQDFINAWNGTNKKTEKKEGNK